MTADERWRPIPDWPGYEISDRGRVRGIERVVVRSDGAKYPVPPRILKTAAHRPSGLPVVKLSRPPRGTGRWCFVHLLMADAFGPGGLR
ncbi:NUMOD4 domain-containing protein [Mycobacterium noviomagense]|uniref:NUMOD4 domain-containing protein n=1 Tax=Mycobacterium noviomagense TaxID=459858 RepID=A0ABX3T8I0_9MYCO|nr:hypothetical protein BST37_05890 [Mycobacterium noviomagense]